MDTRTWKAAEGRRLPVVVEFPDGRRMAFPNGVSTRRLFDLSEALKEPTPSMSAVVDARRMILWHLVPRTAEEVESRRAHMGDSADHAAGASWPSFDDLLDVDFWESSQIAGFLFQTYVMNQEPTSVEEVTDADPPVLSPEPQPASR